MFISLNLKSNLKNMKKTVQSCFLLLFLLLSSAVFAQDRTITGTITSKDDGLPLPGVSVVVKGTKNGTQTNVDGKFSIKLSSGQNQLEIIYVGFTTQTITVGSSNVVNVALENDQKQLSEVVVVGYGTQQRKDLTGSQSSIAGEAISNLATPSFDTQLSGRAAGVQVVQPNGILGQPPAIRIRGANSLTGGTFPLVVIDGVPSYSGNVGGFTPNNALGDINPNDIESFEILKDGAATAIYGSRASNGVILITTKKGKLGVTNFTYDSYFGSAQAQELYDLLDANEFVQISNEKYAAAGQAPQAFLDAQGTNTDWNKQVFRTAFQQSHTLSASGGNDKTKYFVSVGFADQTGIVESNSLERYSFRANLDQKITKWLSFGTNAGVTRQKTTGPLTGSNSLSGNVFATIRMLPNVSPFNPADPTGYNIDAADRRSLGRGANLIPISDGITNIKFVLDNNLRRSTSYRLLGNSFLEAKILDGLTFKSQIGIDGSFVDDYIFSDPRSGDGFSANGTLSQAYSPSLRWNFQNILSFNKVIATNHSLGLTAVAEFQKERNTFFQANIANLADRFFRENIITGSFVTPTINGGIGENGIESYIGRLTYNYKSKYYLTGSLRADGLSKLPEVNRWGYFPSASFAYRVSEEPFFKSSGISKVLSGLRLRGSFGITGNIDISGGNYPYLGVYGAAPYGLQSGVAFSNVGNPDLKWESQEKYDAGIEADFLGGRFSLVAAYYKQDNSDLVLAAPTPPSLGVPGNAINRNVGSLSNDGFEFLVNASILEKGAFKWNSSVNVTTQTSKVKALLDNQDIVGTYTINRVGESFTSLYGYTYLGVNQANGNPLYQKTNGTVIQGNISNSTYYVYDPANPNYFFNPAAPISPTNPVDNRSALTGADRTVLGNSLPKWFGGFDNNFSYKNFDLNVFFRFSGGNMIMNRTRQDLLNMNFVNNGTEILGRWQSPTNPGDGVTPRLYTARGTFINVDNETSTRFLEKGDFLKLTNVTLGYTLPKSAVSKIGLSRVRIFAQGQNLYTLTDYKGLDPETNTGLGVDFNGNPQQRILSVGLNVGF